MIRLSKFLVFFYVLMLVSCASSQSTQNNEQSDSFWVCDNHYDGHCIHWIPRFFE